MTTARAVATALLALSLVSSGAPLRAAGQAPQDQPPSDLSPEALAQIAALLADKAARTPTEMKIDSQLLFEARMESGAPVADGMWAIATDIPYAADGHVVVDVRARSGSGLDGRLAGAGVEIE